MTKNEEKMRVRIATERSDLRDLTAAAIKATYNTRSIGGVERCIDVLNHLKSLSLSVKDINLSLESIVKLETLRTHRNPKIRKEAQALFHSWLKTLYTQGSHNSFKAALTKAPLKTKKHVLTRCSELKKKEERRSMAPEATTISVLKNKEDESSKTLKAVEIKRTIKLSELKKKEDHRSLTRETEKIKKEARNDLLALKQKEDHKSESTCDDLKQLNLKRRRVALEDGTNKKPREGVAYVLSSSSLTKKTKTEKELKDKKVDDMVRLFEGAKKAADVANVKGVLSGKIEASRCIDALSLLMKINITPKPKEPRRMMDRLEGLTKHKDRKICQAASALLHLWRQRIRSEQERKESVTRTVPNNSRKAH